MSNAKIVQMTALFEGQVQGVGFRAKACALASDLGLIATAENLPDGSVRVIAQGTKSELSKLVQELQNKFYVTHVTVSFV